MKKKILLTGGAGFIGSHIAVALVEAGYDPVLIDNFSNSEENVAERLSRLLDRNIIIHRIDCRDEKKMTDLLESEGSAAGIIHLAAFKAVGESVKNPKKYFDNNLGSMISILKIREKFSIPHFVFSSSCTVYGTSHEGGVTENTPFGEAYSPYGYTKQACERILRDVSLQEPAGFSSLRYFNPIGAHSSGLIGELPIGVPNNLVPYITQTAAGIRDKLTVFGTDYNTPDGTCIRDYIHVEDLAEAHVAAMKFMESKSFKGLEVFNIGTGKGESVLKIINTFKQVNQVDFPVEMGERRPGDVESIFAETKKANEILGWKAKRSIEDALKHAWNWEKHLNSK